MQVRFSEWQRELAEEEGEAGAQFWRSGPLAAATALRLPLEAARLARGSFAPRVLERALDPALAARLLALAARCHLPPPTLLLAAFHALLWRLTGLPDLAVAVETDGRRYAELHQALGA